MQIKGIIFDMDGVLIDSEPENLRRHQKFLESMGIKVPHEVIRKFAGAHKKQIFELVKKYGVKQKDYLQYFQEFNVFFEDEPLDFKSILNEGVKDLLVWLEDQNYQIALASSGSIDKINKALTENDIKNKFEVILSGDDFNNSKPDPEIYLKTLELLKLNNDECIVVEDSNYGIQAAKSAKIYTIALEENRFEFMQENADLIVKDLSKVKEFLIRR